MMYKKIFCRGYGMYSLLFLLVGILVVHTLPVHAYIIEPDNIIYGEVFNDEGQRITSSSGAVVTLEVNQAVLASYIMGENPSADDYYILKVPLDSEQPLNPASAHMGDVATIKIDGNPVLEINDINGSTVTIGARGTIQRKKLTAEESPCIPGVEICDGEDNDCDDLIDEGFNIGAVCTVGEGECQRTGTMVCKADGSGSECSAIPGTPADEICDGKDNDCDGQTDEGFSVGAACSVGIGECQRTGTMVCKADGSGTECSAIPGTPTDEICDGKDNDCDGQTDEDIPGCDTPPDGVVYNLNAGWNLITLSLTPDTPYTAATLAAEINTEGGGVTKIQQWDGSGWKTYPVGAPFGDFSIEEGKGYFLLTNKASQWTNTGNRAMCLTYTFASGWNLFGFPTEGSYTAASLSQEINDADGSVTKIQRWDGSGWKTYPVGAPFGDFSINPEEGLFLLTTDSSTFDICQFKISNVRDTQFTISWTSSSPEYGYVNYGTTTSLDNTEYDDRGQIPSTTHHVTITGLLHDTTYYYEVISGSTTFDNGGNYFTITTGPSIIPSGSVIPAGQVFESDGTTAAEGAIVYITIKDIDGQGTQGNSALESVLVDYNGYWNVELVNIRTSNFQNLFNFTQDIDHIVINVNGGSGKKAMVETEATDFNGGVTPRPDIILQ